MYNDPIVEKYINTIKASCKEIRTFFQGDPLKIPASSLPCCIISRVATQSGFLDSANDEHNMTLHITVVTDIRSELSTEENVSKIAPGVAKLYDIIEGRNADYTLKDSSILKIIRTNQPIDLAHNLRTDLHTQTRVDYGTTMRNRNPAEWSIEATVEVVSNFIQLR